MRELKEYEVEVVSGGFLDIAPSFHFDSDILGFGKAFTGFADATERGFEFSVNKTGDILKYTGHQVHNVVKKIF